MCHFEPVVLFIKRGLFVLGLFTVFLQAENFSEYKNESNKKFLEFKGEKTNGIPDSERDRGLSRGNPCEENTGYGCTKTARDDQLKAVMEEDDDNFSQEEEDEKNEDSGD